MLPTLVDLFCTKRLFSLETAFLQDYFTRDKNGRNSFSKEFHCSCAINSELVLFAEYSISNIYDVFFRKNN